MQNKDNKKHILSIREIALFAMLGTLMFCSKIIMEILPNIHLLGTFTMLITIVFRKKALLPIYLYVLINGVYSGFALWWIPYLYVWTVLWVVTMLIPKTIPDRIAMIIYPLVCALHGFAFGILYAPSQALIFGFDFKQTLSWVLAGFPFDLIHGISNLFTGMLVLPLSKLLRKIV
ncbi:MAG: hypothetical protein U0L72_07295 [Acutalibacteraceae bacterium]|nr:hypothetical protein [Acutalibacteraceae bacterium]